MEIKYKALGDIPLDSDRIVLKCEDCPVCSACDPVVKDRVESDGTKVVKIEGKQTATEKCRLPLIL